ncbi:hypothetical protein JXA47_07115 [Candidatus Sumerlaeota bacterium]|nr:hypothetical protein [Candidatus Sumerlaeota bacterium]
MSRFRIPVFHLGLGLLAGSLLAYELLLLRLFKIAQGSEFTSIAISIALLGFGASGTLLAIARPFALRRARAIAVLSAPLAGLAMLGAFFIEQSVPFRPEFLVWGGRHVWHLLLWTLPLVVPFLIGAVGLGVVFVRWPRQTRSLYAANLLGSGLGAAGLYAMLHWLRPEDGILLVASLAALAGGLMALPWSRQVGLCLLILFAVGINQLIHIGMPEIRISDTRDLWLLRQLPDQHMALTWIEPEGRVDLIMTPAFHWTPGESLRTPASGLTQTAITLDGNLVGDLVWGEFLGDPLQLRDFLCATPWAAAAELRGFGRALFLDTGSELELWRITRLRTPQGQNPWPSASVTLCHPNSRVLDVLRNAEVFDPNWQRLNPHGEAARRQSVFVPKRWAVAAALQMLRVGDRPWNLIVSVSQGAEALQEDSLHTEQAVRRSAERLDERGVLVLATPVSLPARTSLRLFALVAESIRALWSEENGDRLVAIRSFSQMAVVLSPSGFHARELRRIRGAAHRWNFDLVWAPDISPDEVNQFNILDEPIFYETARRIFAGEAEEVYREYPFDLRPPTEWWPFFWQPFKPATVWGMLIGLRPGGLETIPEANAVLALIYQIRALALAALVLILLPLLWLRAGAVSASRLRAFGYFGCIGVGYLTLEILMIFMARRYLGTPVLAATVTLAVFLVGSGLGSLMSRRVRWVFPGILLGTGLAVALLEMLIHQGAGLGLPVRIALAALLMLPMAWFLGMPFPRGLQALDRFAPPLVPWAWGVNGFASVLAAPLATLFALTGGYQVALGVGLAAYVGASLIFPRGH